MMQSILGPSVEANALALAGQQQLVKCAHRRSTHDGSRDLSFSDQVRAGM